MKRERAKVGTIVYVRYKGNEIPAQIVDINGDICSLEGCGYFMFYRGKKNCRVLTEAIVFYVDKNGELQKSLSGDYPLDKPKGVTLKVCSPKRESLVYEELKAKLSKQAS